MSDILNEQIADKIVIRNLVKEIRRLKGNNMGKILMDQQGELYHAESYEPLNESAVKEKVERAKNELEEYDTMLKLSDQLKSVGNTDTASESVPAEGQQPVENSAPQEAATQAPVIPPAQEQVATPEPAPIEQPVQPQNQPQPIVLQ